MRVLTHMDLGALLLGNTLCVNTFVMKGRKKAEAYRD